MGLRYRKSINLGGGFRVNLSKSGVGYSWGVKGYRVTRSANGRTRTTASIPGTGISWVEEGSGKRQQRQLPNGTTPRNSPVVDNNHYDTVEISNNITHDTISEGLEDMVVSAQRLIRLNKTANLLIWISLFIGIIVQPVLLILLASIIFKIVVITKGVINLEYTIDSDQIKVVENRMKTVLEIMKCNKVWRIMQSSKVIDTKYTAGASTTVKRVSCATGSKPPFPFKTNSQVAIFKLKNETLMFLPDKLFVIAKNKIGVLDYNDFTKVINTRRFIEDGAVPKDATIVGKTWKYVNKSGGPDKRFKNNRQLPICSYGKMILSSQKGLNTEIMFSKQITDYR